VRILRPASVSPSSLAMVSTWAPSPPIEPSSTVTTTSWLASAGGSDRCRAAWQSAGRRPWSKGPWLQRVGRLQRLGQPGAEREDSDLLAFAHHPALADLQLLRLRAGPRRCRCRADSGRRSAAVMAARRYRSCGPVPPRRRRPSPPIGQGREIGDVERCRHGSRRPRRPVPARSIAKAHRQVLDRHVMDHLVIRRAAGRSNRSRRTAASLRGQARRESHRVLFGNADVKAAVGMAPWRTCPRRCRRHGGGDRADRGSSVGQLGQRFAEHVLVGLGGPAAP
jgi:hypothetical protein